jgi:hypothetical protein
MSDPNPDWCNWHDCYQLEAGSHLVRRLAVVQHALTRALDSSPGGPMRVASPCAGFGYATMIEQGE